MANNDQNNNKNGKGRNNLRGILTLVAWALVLTVGFNYLNAYNRNATNKSTSHEIKYSEMLDLIENDKAKEVLFKDDAIYITPVEGYTYTEEQDEDSNVPAKSYTQSKDTKLTLYTAYLNDTSLLPLLKEHKVAYTGYYEAQMNPVLAFMVSYILPTLIFVGLLMLLLRMLAKSGGSGFGVCVGIPACSRRSSASIRLNSSRYAILNCIAVAPVNPITRITKPSRVMLYIFDLTTFPRLFFHSYSVASKLSFPKLSGTCNNSMSRITLS